MTRRKDGLWQESITINGKRKYFYGRTKGEVLRKINEYKDEETKGKPFGAVAELWWEEHLENLEYNSTRNYKPAYERARDYFNDVPIKEIQPVQISAFVSDFAKSHAQKTVDTQLLIFRLIFTYAVNHGYCSFNVARDIKVKAKVPKNKRHMPSREDIALIKRSAGCTFGLYPIWLMYTGLRKSELLSLRYENIDKTNRRITVSQSMYCVGNTPHVKQPKTETSLAVIPIIDALLPYVEDRKSGYVFPNSDGGLMKESQFRALYKKYQAESGVTCTSHQLRHAFATMLYEANIPPEQAQILLRHAQYSTTMDTYTDIREEKKRQAFADVMSVDFL